MPDERTTLKHAIDAYLKTLAPAVWYRKRWGGGVYQHSGEWDYVLCAWGLHVEIEAKHPIKKPKLPPDQVAHGRRIRAAGGVTVSVCSAEDVRKAMMFVREHVLNATLLNGGHFGPTE